MNRFAIVVAMLGLAPASATASNVIPGEEHCVVNVATWDRLNIRTSPSSQAPVVRRRHYGSCGIFVVGKCRSQWCPVEDGHSAGWANRRFLSMVSPALYCTKGLASGSLLKLRAYPSATSRVLKALNPHTCDISFLPYARKNWQKIRVQGFEGWILQYALSGQ